MPSPLDITGLLDDWGRGDPRALDRLVPRVYLELRRVAARQLRMERNGHTLVLKVSPSTARRARRTARAWAVVKPGAESRP